MLGTPLRRILGCTLDDGVRFDGTALARLDGTSELRGVFAWTGAKVIGEDVITGDAVTRDVVGAGVGIGVVGVATKTVGIDVATGRAVVGVNDKKEFTGAKLIGTNVTIGDLVDGVGCIVTVGTTGMVGVDVAGLTVTGVTGGEVADGVNRVGAGVTRGATVGGLGAGVVGSTIGGSVCPVVGTGVVGKATAIVGIDVAAGGTVSKASGDEVEAGAKGIGEDELG